MTGADPGQAQATRREPFEVDPTWNQPDLVLEDLTAIPEHPSPGDQVTLAVRVSNRGQGRATHVEILFSADGNEVARSRMEELRPGSTVSREVSWHAQGGGERHHLYATASSEQMDGEKAGPRSRADLDIWAITSRGSDVPALRVDVRSLTPTPGERATLRVEVTNVGTGASARTPLSVRMDNEQLVGREVRPLPPGSTAEFEAQWTATAGDHLLAVVLGSADLPLPPGTSTWGISVSGPIASHVYPAGQGLWASLGPRILSDGNAGRMEDLVFDPVDPGTAYAVSEVGGIWRTQDGGDSWRAVGDGLPTLNFVKVAVDPQNPRIVYAATASEGLWKSLDSGQNWSPFADPAHNDRDMVGVRALVVRNSEVEGQRVIVYVACDAGLLKYTSDDPWQISTSYSDWDQMLSDPVWDLAVHPHEPTALWASVNRWDTGPGGVTFQRLDRIASQADASAPWTSGTGLPSVGLAKIDVSPSAPKALYASVWAPSAQEELALYRSTDSGATWQFVCSYPRNTDYWTTMYNPFVRVDPGNALVVFVAGTQLYRIDTNAALYTKRPHTRVVNGGHPDIKQLRFPPRQLPTESRPCWVLSDGGIWEVIPDHPEVPPRSRNNELRTVQFYDLETSDTDSQLMIGGTQDNCTLRYRGNSAWDVIGPEGDGNYSRISATNPSRMYAQGQFLDSTYRTDNGLDPMPSWSRARGSESHPLPPGVSDGYLALDGLDDRHLLAVGDQVRESTDSGDSWYPRGPVAGVGQPPVRGAVTRVLFEPAADSHTWLAGTSGGDLWWHANGAWTRIFSHADASGQPDNAAVTGMVFSPCDDTILYVLFSGGDPKHRIYQFTHSGGAWSAEPIAHVFPVNVRPRVLCGDAHLSTVLYVGTAHGVYRGERAAGLGFTWMPYNDGLPRAAVNSLRIDRTTGELRAGTNGRGAWAVKT